MPETALTTLPAESSVLRPIEEITDSLMVAHGAEQALVHNTIISLGANGSLMNEAEVRREFGVSLGSLEAIIQLPSQFSIFHKNLVESARRDIERTRRTRKNRFDYEDALSLNAEPVDPLYCFKVTDTPRGRHMGADAGTSVSYALATASQIDALRHTPETSLGREDLEASIVVLHPGQRLRMGRHQWLPGIGKNIELARAEGMKYKSISDNHGAISIDEKGNAMYTDSSKNGTQVEVRATSSPEEQLPPELLAALQGIEDKPARVSKPSIAKRIAGLLSRRR